MADRVKGITVEIGGDTGPLSSALKGVNGEIRTTQSQLKDVNRLLKLDPTNMDLLNQKSSLLAKEIDATKQKLETLKQANEQVAKSAENYDAWKAKYTPIQQEIDNTTKKLEELKSKDAEMKKALNEGKISSEQYDAYQKEIEETEKKLEELKGAAQAVDDEFGHPISTEQMQGLQREIVDTEQKLKELNKESQSGAMTAYGEKMKAAGDNISSVGQKMLPVTAGIAALGTASVKTASDFETSMSQTAGALDLPMDKMSDLQQLALQMGQDTQFSATEVGNAMTELAKGGMTEADIKAGALKTTLDLAASSGMDLGSAANVVVQQMGAFDLSANESAQAANALAGAAAASSTDVEPLTEGLSQCAAQAHLAGWSIQDTTAVLGAFADAGIEGSDAGTNLKTMLQRLSAPTDAASKLMQQYGINVRDSNGNMKNATEIAGVLQSSLGSLSPATRDAAMQTIFGSDATRAATVMMSEGAAGLQKYTQATNDQAAAQRLANSQMGPTEKAIEQLKGSIETAGIAMGQILLPVVQKVADFLSTLANAFTSLSPQMQQVITTVLAIVAAVGPLLLIVGKIASAIGSLMTVLPMIAGAIAPILPVIASALPIIAAIIAAITAVILIIQNWGTISEWFQNLWSTVCGAVQAAWSALQSAWTTVWTAIANNPVIQAVVSTVTTLWQTASDTLSGIWNGIKDIASGAWELIKNVVLAPVLLLIDLLTGDFDGLKSDLQNIWNNIKDAAQTVWNGIKQVVGSIATGFVNTLKTIFGGLASAVSSIWDGIKSTVVNIANNIKNGAVSAFNALKSGISNVVKAIPGVVQSGFNGAISFITSLPSRMFNWGKEMIQSLVNGIKNMFGAVKNAIGNVANAIRSVLHFSVPDEGPLKDIGSWMPDMMHTLANGITGNIGLIKSAVGKVAENMVLPNISMNASATGGTGQLTGNTAYNINVYASNINDPNRTALEIGRALEFQRQRRAVAFGGT